jgi:holo-[acyl-carrier protein] synthase
VILGLGHDICAIERFEVLLHKQALLEKIFGKEELAEASEQGVHQARYLAGRWAAKESLSKALGKGLFEWSLPEAQWLSNQRAKGKRAWLFSGSIFSTTKSYQVHTSLSYEKGLASAVTIIWQDKGCD